MTRYMLSPEEREEYDALLAEAGFDDNKQVRETAEIGGRMRRLLEDAEQAGKSWARWIIEDDQESGHADRFKKWRKARERVRVYDPRSGTLTSRPAAQSVKHRRSDGHEAHQLTLWREMDWTQLQEMLESSYQRIRSDRINAATAQKLLSLRERAPGTSGPLEACELLGLDFDSYLADAEAV